MKGIAKGIKASQHCRFWDLGLRVPGWGGASGGGCMMISRAKTRLLEFS